MKSSELSKEQIAKRQVKQYTKSQARATRRRKTRDFWDDYVDMFFATLRVCSIIAAFVLVAGMGFGTLLFGAVFPIVTMTWWMFVILPVGIALTVLAVQFSRWLWNVYEYDF